MPTELAAATPQPYTLPTPGTVAYNSRSRYLYAKYGITEQQYEDMLKRQNGVCLICRLPHHPENPLVVDHNHATGQVRGLLCSGCNTGIGLLQDSPFLCMVAAVYISSEGSYGPPA